MAVTGISFFYDEEKIEILKEQAELEKRTLSGYIQIILQDAIDENPASPSPVVIKPQPKKVKRVVKRRIK